jgi:hypothetical protein
MPRCGAIKRQGEGECQQPAGWGTDHPGTGRCKLHGGASPSGPESARYVHGLYSADMPPEEAADFDDWKKAFSVDDWTEEVALAGWRWYRWLATADFREVPDKDGHLIRVPIDPLYGMKVLETFVSCRERLVKSQKGIVVRVELADDQLAALLDRVADMICERVTLRSDRDAVIAGLRELLDEYGGKRSAGT